MNTLAKVVLGVGALVTLIGLVALFTGDSIEDKLGDGIIYEGAEGEMKITGKSGLEIQGFGFYVHIKSTYEGGGSGGYNYEHGNYTWDLTQSDCNLVKNFTLTNNNEGKQVFIPRCNYIDDNGDSADDGWIVVGTLCTQKMSEDRNLKGDGCPNGTYTWDTNNEVVMVYDLDEGVKGAIEWFFNLLGSLGACCCGSIIIIIGIILAFTMDDPKESAINTTTKTVNPYQSNVPEKKGASGWNEQEDYIHKSDDKTKSDFEKADKDGDGKIDENEFADMMKSGMAIPNDEEKPKEKKRSGEYELPPPPEY